MIYAGCFVNSNANNCLISSMRLFYFYLWVVFQYSLRLYFRRVFQRNKSPYAFGRTIFVSNHQGSFMDPLLIASLRKPIVYFMVRADVFNRFTERIFWSAHMLPIYRQRDGVETIEKNQAIFEKTDRLLKNRRNILIFGEGFTHDRIQRRLHPIKKGAARIGFSALEADQWKHPIYLQGLGINYADFNLRRSDVLVDAGEMICLNDYQQAYLENPSKTIAEVTRRLDASMRTLIPDVNDPEASDLHEDVMMLTRKGIHPTCFDGSCSFEQRWSYALQLARWINDRPLEDHPYLIELKSEIHRYKEQLKVVGVTENERFLKKHHPNASLLQWMKSIFLLPFAVLGFVHAALPVHAIKWWVEKSFKRPVYWGSTKMVVAIFLVPLLNLPWLLLLPSYLPFESYVNWIISSVYFISIGLFAQAYMLSLDAWKKAFRALKVRRKNTSSLDGLHGEIMRKIQENIPVA